jgi:hypothetical protein
MTTQPKGAFTFHKVREQGEQGSPEAWRAFLEFYTPLAFHLLAMYFPADAAAAGRVWQKTLAVMTENNFQRFRDMERQSERGFLVELRSLLLDEAAAAATVADPGAPPLDLDILGKLLDQLPLLHEEMLFLKLAGYTDPSIERMLRMTPRVARAAFARLEPDYAAALQSQTDRCLWPRRWLALAQQARAQKQEACPPLYQFMRILDGQVSWYDKEPVEKQVCACRHCLEAWTALREVTYWRNAAPAASPERIEGFLRSLPLAAARKKSLLQRMFR